MNLPFIIRWNSRIRSVDTKLAPRIAQELFWPRITKFYVDIHTVIIYSHTGYDVIINFRSKVAAKNCWKYRLVWLRVEFIENGLCIGRITEFFTHLSRTIVLTNLPVMTSPAASDQHFSKFENGWNAASDGFVCIKSNAVSKASSYSPSEEYQQRFLVKRRGLSPSPTLWWASC